ncbi:hypothetical protein EON81_01440 [bacterium]|nr:MAG: hypothetical protein EON81_01440 [bacterium]
MNGVMTAEVLLRVLFADMLAASRSTIRDARCHPFWPLVQDAWAPLSHEKLAVIRDEDGVVAYVIEQGRILEPEDWAKEVQSAPSDLTEIKARIFGEVTRNTLFGAPKAIPRSPWDVRAIPAVAKSPTLRRRSVVFGGERPKIKN